MLNRQPCHPDRTAGSRRRGIRYLTAPVLNRTGLLGNRYVWIAIGLVSLSQPGFTYLPFMQNLFAFALIGFDAWPRIITAGVLVFTLVEVEKAFFRRRAGSL